MSSASSQKHGLLAVAEQLTMKEGTMGELYGLISRRLQLFGRKGAGLHRKSRDARLCCCPPFRVTTSGAVVRRGVGREFQNVEFDTSRGVKNSSIFSHESSSLHAMIAKRTDYASLARTVMQLVGETSKASQSACLTVLNWFNS